MKPKVAFIAQPEYFRFSYEHDLDGDFKVQEFKFNYSMALEDLKELVDYKADFNVSFRGEFLPRGLLERLNGIKIALSSEPFPRVIDGRYEFTRDSIDRYCAFRRIRNMPFDYVFHYDKASLPYFEKDGLHLSGEFPFPVATHTYIYKPSPKDWDLFFIGRSTPHRESYFGHLKHYYNFLHICHGIWGPDLVDYINSSKICLNIHAEDEISWEPRVQMLLSCKAFLITEKITPNTYLRPGTDYIEANSPREALEAVSYYLKHEDERIQVADSGYNRIREVLDSQSRYIELFNHIKDQKYPRFQVKSKWARLDMCSTTGKMLFKANHIIRKLW